MHERAFCIFSAYFPSLALGAWEGQQRDPGVELLLYTALEIAEIEQIRSCEDDRALGW